MNCAKKGSTEFVVVISDDATKFLSSQGLEVSDLALYNCDSQNTYSMFLGTIVHFISLFYNEEKIQFKLQTVTKEF